MSEQNSIDLSMSQLSLLIESVTLWLDIEDECSPPGATSLESAQMREILDRLVSHWERLLLADSRSPGREAVS